MTARCDGCDKFPMLDVHLRRVEGRLLCWDCWPKAWAWPSLHPDERDVYAVPDDDAERIREYLRENPELIKDQYQRDDPGLDGHCYVAAEAYYHARGCDLDVYCLSWENGGTHWYIADEDHWIDLTLESGPPFPPYAEGTRRGSITGDEPSKRTQQVLTAVGVVTA